MKNDIISGIEKSKSLNTKPMPDDSQEQPKEKQGPIETPENAQINAAKNGKKEDVRKKFKDDGFLEKTPSKKMSAEEVKSILSEPDKFRKHLKEYPIKRQKKGQKTYEWKNEQDHDLPWIADHVRQMLEVVKDDTKFMLSLIQSYAKGNDFEQGDICATAIEMMGSYIDDAFFKGIFEGSTDPHIRCAVLHKIVDVAFLKEVANSYRYATVGSDEGSAALKNLQTLSYPREIAQDKAANINMRINAVDLISDYTVLKNLFIDTEKDLLQMRKDPKIQKYLQLLGEEKYDLIDEGKKDPLIEEFDQKRYFKLVIMGRVYDIFGKQNYEKLEKE